MELDQEFLYTALVLGKNLLFDCNKNTAVVIKTFSKKKRRTRREESILILEWHD